MGRILRNPVSRSEPLNRTYPLTRPPGTLPRREGWGEGEPQVQRMLRAVGKGVP
jgi:hypothetical protein